jgi:putative ABC transport system ATP-binding protein
MEKNVIEMRGVVKNYQVGTILVPAVRGVDLTVKEKEFVAIMGASGSGKSTLMNLIGCLDVPTSGEYFLDGLEIGKQTGNTLADIRNTKIGFVFQTFNLLSRMSALENVEVPMLYNRNERIRNLKERAEECLVSVGLQDRMHHQPHQLSGGQQQRVAIARALVNKPAILLADEPTGALDTATSIEVMALFQQLNDSGITIVLVTHEPDISLHARRIVRMQDGRVILDEPVANRVIADPSLLTREAS